MAKDRWLELCQRVEADDGLPAWSVGQWTEDKLFFWHRYIDITTTAMSANASFPGGLVYIDLFAGAGVCTLRESRQRIPGSVLIAAYAARPFAKIVACEREPSLADACKARLDTTPAADHSTVLTGDCNQLIDDVVRIIPPRTLTLAFVDPKGLDAHFETLCVLCNKARADLVILLADAYDINRNVASIYRKDPNSKLDRVLGPDSRWREELDELDSPTGPNKRKLFAEVYKRQLRHHLEYTCFGDKVMSSARRPLYRLIYASKHNLGLKFWYAALKKDASGQREFDF